ncbi:MerR family transcriptional regulator [Nonomuraea sp. NPDC050404]|uniref:MerR family transcriptional regulator n=1 Tax=Nonomuraea sp. NPDC050404 TaxID=3155783 RepID=UPI0033DEAB32
MDGDTLYSIGDLARRTGLTVKTIRFYSDEGIVPPTARSPAGYRLYDLTAAARLDLVRTLRDLGLDLPTIRAVVDRELSLPEVAAAHAEALETQIRALRVRRAVLTAVARRGSTPEETELMHKLAKLSKDERHRLINDFLSAAFGDAGPSFAGAMTSLTPELPDDPAPEQVEAWVELAELSRDPDFRASIARMAELHGEQSVGVLRPDPAALARDLAAPALAAGLDPASPEARPYVTSLITSYARHHGLNPDDPGLTGRLTARLEAANDPRWDTYTRLLAVINGWVPPQELSQALDWFTRALSTHSPTAGNPA